MAEEETIGVVLLNMGGPDTLEDVEPFLLGLFSDRQIIRLSPFPFLQKFIARRIARSRAPKSREAYRLIGGGSPQKRLTLAQGEALAAVLAPAGSFRVDMAMRYWSPRAEETLREMAAAGIRRLVALSLYPHFSKATGGSSLADLKRAAAVCGHPFEIAEISSWPEAPRYVECLAADISRGLATFPDNGETVVVYSAHSLPVKFIDEGDPYLDHLRATIAAVEARTGVGGRLCFQSRSGPVQWLRPSTPEMLEQLAGEGFRQVLMVPISFVSDHVETLYEIDILYREQAAALGLRLVRTEGLNARPEFIAALGELVLERCRRQNWLTH
ncbi:MAG: ferrochelatase [Desulfobulbaceae bacterium]|nr:ferrochelatase [Desulfobulbaceae bacterium]